MEADRIALHQTGGLKAVVFDDVWRFQRLLRRLEFAVNRDSPSRYALALLYRRQSRRLGFSIPPNVFGPGLSIAHPGTIIVNDGARVGANCRLHACVVIGSIGGPGDAPVIGDDCYIGPGAKIYGPIRIGDHVTIGANAVVNRSFPEGHVRIAGVPARPLPPRTPQLD